MCENCDAKVTKKQNKTKIIPRHVQWKKVNKNKFLHFKQNKKNSEI
jgi:hypothetical protein